MESTYFSLCEQRRVCPQGSWWPAVCKRGGEGGRHGETVSLTAEHPLSDGRARWEKRTPDLSTEAAGGLTEMSEAISESLAPGARMQREALMAQLAQVPDSRSWRETLRTQVPRRLLLPRPALGTQPRVCSGLPGRFQECPSRGGGARQSQARGSQLLRPTLGQTPPTPPLQSPRHPDFPAPGLIHTACEAASEAVN